MNALELARLQFGVTTLFHFIFVPMSIGLAIWVAYCQTRWYRTGDELYLRMTRFWGKFMLISLAIGVVTGLVQEFQFGMNWSQYSRYVGDIFGAPLAMEGLMAFFLESTFIGLWLFGWGRLSPKVHLATMWLTAFGTVLSAYFILAANSWMQHPVGYVINHSTHRAELKSIGAVLTNSTVLLAFPHTIFGAICTGGMLVLGISALGMLRGRNVDVFSRSVRMVLPLTLIAAIATGAAGHAQGTLMEKQQPMKMASAEALYNTTKGASLSVFAAGPFERHPSHLGTDIRIPHLLSIIGTASWRTRIALARARLSGARFLILDEPTAHLEPELAARVMANLLDVCDDRGLLVITHDAAALEGFDRVLRLQHGSIASRDAQRSALALA